MSAPTGFRKSYWSNRLHSWLRDQTKNSGSPSITISLADLVDALYDPSAHYQVTPRQITRTARDLHQQGRIDIEWNLSPNGGSAPSTYTVLPLESHRLVKLGQFSQLLSLSPGEAMRAIDRLLRTPYDPESATLQTLADIAGYTGRPSALVTALKMVGLVGDDGLIGW